MSLHSLIANGGKVLVVGGTMNKGWESFRAHPAIVFWCGSQSEIERHLKNGNNFPDNVKGVVISRFISHAQSGKVMEEARRKRALILASKNDGEITRILEEIVTKPEVKETHVVEGPHGTPMTVTAPEPILRAPHSGELADFVAKNWTPGEPNVVAARRILPMMAAQGIRTTEGSIAQAITQLKRKIGVGAKSPVVASATPVAAVDVPTVVKKSAETPEDDLLKVIADAKLSLQLVEDEVKKFKSDRAEYQRLREKLAALLKGEQ
jgi:hypothetical protein